MAGDFSKNTDTEVKSKIQEWSEAMFTATKKGADINAVMLYTPLIQMARNEMTSRFVKRTTKLVIGVAILSQAASSASLLVVLLSSSQ